MTSSLRKRLLEINPLLEPILGFLSEHWLVQLRIAILQDESQISALVNAHEAYVQETVDAGLSVRNDPELTYQGIDPKSAQKFKSTSEKLARVAKARELKNQIMDLV